MTKYAQTVAAMMDAGLGNSAIAEALLRQYRAGEIEAPDDALFIAERFEMLLAQASGEQDRRLGRMLFDQERPDWFCEGNARRAIRRFLQSKNYTLAPDQMDRFVADEGAPPQGLMQGLRALLGARDKHETLRSLHVLGPDGRWCEPGFQRMMEAIDAPDADMSKPPAGLEALRWRLHERHYIDTPIIFAHALMNDDLPQPVILRAHRIARMALSHDKALQLSRMERMLRREQVERLRRVGAWLHGPAFMESSPALCWIGLMAAEPGINWARYRDITAFIHPKLEGPVDSALIKDWLDGLVTFEGEGVVRAGMNLR